MATGKGKARRTPAPAADPTPAGKIVALAARKGGVGKSTVACCLAAESLARGLRVLLIDADPQATAIMWGKARARREGDLLLSVRAMGAEMADDLPPLAREVDLTIIDCPGWTDRVQRSALMVADLVLLPSAPTAFDSWSLKSGMAPLLDARRVRPELDAAAVVSRKQAGTLQGQGARELFEQIGLSVLKSELGQRVAFSEATGQGMTVSEYAPRSEAAREIKALTAEVLARLGIGAARRGAAGARA